MDFIAWWFETHYIASTIFTPFMQWMYLLFTDGSIGHMFVAGGWWFCTGILRANARESEVKKIALKVFQEQYQYIRNK